MIPVVVVNFVDLFAIVFEVLLLIRVVLSYVASPANRFNALIISLTEPLLLPIRGLLPRTGGADFSPIVAFLLLQGLQYLVHFLLNM